MKPRRRHFLQTLSAVAALQAQSPRRPNLLILMSDQHRAGLTKRSGFPFDTMPTLDRLAAAGVAFDKAYSTAPMCAPARVSLLTGRWPHAHRVRQNSTGRLALYEKDIFQVTRELGYRTAIVGKDHSHVTAGLPPRAKPDRLDFYRGYNHHGGWKPEPAPKASVELDAWLSHLNHGVAQEPTPFPLEAQLPHRITSDAIEFLQGVGESPFTLWISFPEPHNPYQVPKPYFDMFPPASLPARTVGPEALASKGWKWQFLRKLEEETYPGYDDGWRRTRSNYLGMLRLIDDQIDRLLRHLRGAGQLDNTIIVFLTDHGDFFCDYGLNRKGVELPEALIRIPMVWSGAGIRAQSNHPAMVSTADIFPTLCEAIGVPPPRGVQGRSLWPLLQGREYPRQEFESIFAEVGYGGMHYGPKDDIPKPWGRLPGVPGAIPTFDELNPVTQSGTLKMVRVGDWKLQFDMMGSGQLHDLSADPYELRDLFGRPEHAAIQQRLTAELLRWTLRTQDDLPVGAYPHKWPTRNWNSMY